MVAGANGNEATFAVAYADERNQVNAAAETDGTAFFPRTLDMRLNGKGPYETLAIQP